MHFFSLMWKRNGCHESVSRAGCGPPADKWTLNEARLQVILPKTLLSIPANQKVPVSRRLQPFCGAINDSNCFIAGNAKVALLVEPRKLDELAKQ